MGHIAMNFAKSLSTAFTKAFSATPEQPQVVAMGVVLMDGWVATKATYTQTSSDAFVYFTHQDHQEQIALLDMRRKEFTITVPPLDAAPDEAVSLMAIRVTGHVERERAARAEIAEGKVMQAMISHVYPSGIL
jgi:hypothetical protein